MVPVLISDLDGTILDVRERTAYSHLLALRKAGYEVELEQIRQLNQYTINSRELLTHLNIELTSHKMKSYISTLMNYFYRNWRISQVVPGAIDALRRTRKNFQSFLLITSRQRSTATEKEVRRFGLAQLFDKLITRGDLARAEGVNHIPLYPFVPHRRRLLHLALQGLDLQREVWVVGDSPAELKAAKSLGFITIGVLTGVGTQEDMAPWADHILNSITEIESLI